MKYTLLEMVQMILSSLDGDEITAITDTVEAQQIALIVKNTYFDIISSLDLPEHKDLFELTETTISTPVVMSIPTSVTNIEWVKYNNYTTANPINQFLDVSYLDLKSFIEMQQSIDTTITATTGSISVTTNGSDTLTLPYWKDRHPKWYTTTDENKLLFDAYDASVDTFLRKDKTQAFGSLIPTWTASDSFTPDLDARQFTLLLNEAKAQAFLEMKQQQNPKAEKRARRGWIQAQRTKSAIKLPADYRSYGRK